MRLDSGRLRIISLTLLGEGCKILKTENVDWRTAINGQNTENLFCNHRAQMSELKIQGCWPDLALYSAEIQMLKLFYGRCWCRLVPDTCNLAAELSLDIYGIVAVLNKKNWIYMECKFWYAWLREPISLFKLWMAVLHPCNWGCKVDFVLNSCELYHLHNGTNTFFLQRRLFTRRVFFWQIDCLKVKVFNAF